MPGPCSRVLGLRDFVSASTGRIRHVLVEVMTFEGCPQAAPAVALARRVADEAGICADVRLVDVAGGETERQRFLGSPSIRVDGRDVEPGAELRRDYAHGCRLYATSTGRSALPDETWLRDALVARR
jgi:hypothetical protein